MKKQVFETFFLDKSSKLTREGFLKTKAAVTRAGVFKYFDSENNRIVNVLRPEQEVFNDESLDTMKLMPVLNGHPSDPDKPFVDIDDIKEKGIGSLGDSIKREGNLVTTNAIITDKDAIEQITSNKRREVSMGYSASIVPEEGVYMDEPYQMVQKNISYNHAALVQKGRAGHDVRLFMDSAPDCFVMIDEDDIHKFKQNKKPEGKKTMKKIILDEIEYEAAPEVINALNKARAYIDQLIEEKKAMIEEQKSKSEESEQTEAQLDSMKEELKRLKTRDFEKEILDGAEKRIALLDSIKSSFGDDVYAKIAKISAEKEVKKEVLKAVLDSINLDEKSESYIDARFDIEIENRKNKPIQMQREQISSIKAKGEGIVHDELDEAAILLNKRLSK